MEIDLPIILWCTFALLCGGYIKGILGIGTPLLTVPMMSIVIAPQSAIAIMAIPIITANLWQALQAPKGYPVFKNHWATASGILAGTLIGTSLLSTLDETPLMILFGCIVIGYTALQLNNRNIYIPHSYVRSVGVFSGALAGFIGGVSSMFGPVLVMYLMSIKNLDKNGFVSTISFLYLCAVMPWTFLLLYYGILNSQLLVGSAISTVPVLTGMLAGRQQRSKLNNSQFRFGVLLVLLLSGVTLLLRTLI